MISTWRVGKVAAACISIAITSFFIVPVPAIASAAFVLRGRTSQGLPVRVVVANGLSTIERFEIQWRARCTTGATLSHRSVIRRVVVDSFPSFHAKRMYTTKTATYSAAHSRQLTSAVSLELRGALLLGGRVRGTWTANARVLDSSRTQVDTCRSGLVHWNAKLT